MLHTPSAWVHIADDNTITLISARAEMGQGVYTSMPMLIAEELNIDIQKVKVAFAPPGKVYGNALIFGLQLTGGSTSVREGYDKLRLAGAQVREMLVAAAADVGVADADRWPRLSLRGAIGRRIALGSESRRDLHRLEELLETMKRHPDPAVHAHEIPPLEAEIEALVAYIHRAFHPVAGQ